MAKRFTDSEKWKKPFIRTMQAPYKLLWLYIIDECNHAGIWQVDMEVASLKIGEKLNIEEALKSFAGKISVIDNGEKWFIPEFIEFQYGALNPSNRVHESVISLLLKFNLIDEDLKIKDLISPLQRAMDKDKDKDKDKDNISKGVKIHKPEFSLHYPFNSEKFMQVWNILIREKKWNNKSPAALQASLNKLWEHPEDVAIKMIENTIAGGWQGLFEIDTKKVQKNGNQSVTSKHDTIRDAVTESLRIDQEALANSNGSGEESY